MPTTPEVWIDNFIVNTVTSGFQNEARVIQLANGNILITWTSTADAGAAAGFGVDIVGQIFNPLGVPVGDEFRVNQSYVADDERDASIAPLPDGGFVMVFEDVNAGVTGLRLEEFNADGSQRTSQSVANDGNVAFANFANPDVAVSSATSALVAYERIESATDTDIVFRLYNPATDVLGAETNLFTNGTRYSGVSIDVLNNGNYVAVVSDDEGDGAGGEGEIRLSIISPLGGSVQGNTAIASTESNGENDREATVTALTGGGFVVAWTNTDANDTDVKFQRFAADGALQGTETVVNGGSFTNNNNEPVIAALNDGGFIVFYDDDDAVEISGQRYSSTGSTVGSSFLVDAGVGTDIDATLIDDGRVIVTWRIGGNVQSKIVDVRDNIATGDYDPQDWSVGTVGDDTFIGTGAAELVYGYNGNDSLNGAAGDDTLYGGSGMDRISGGLGNDTMVGGTGSDTYFVDSMGDIVEEGIFGGFDQVFATVSHTLATNVENLQLLGTANLTGTGNTGNNRLVGNAGDNVLAGLGGADVIIAAAGNDTLNGGTGDDVMFGRQGDDVYNVDSFGDRAIENPGQGYDIVNATSNFTLSGGVEELRLFNGAGLTGVGNNQANRITGTGAADSINGQGGDDILVGGSGGDSLVGGTGADRMFGQLGDDFYYVDSSADQAIENPGSGYDTVLSLADFTLGANVEELRLLGGAQLSAAGNGTANRLIGNVANNTLAGGSGDDVLIGAGGADRMVGGTGNDRMFGGANADSFVLQNGWGVDRAEDFSVASGDVIDLSAVAEITSYADLAANHLANIGGQAVIVDGGNTLTLIGVARAALSADDFLF